MQRYSSQQFILLKTPRPAEREVRFRMKSALDSDVYFTNYGITIAYMQGILRRSLEIFPQLLSEIPTQNRK